MKFFKMYSISLNSSQDTGYFSLIGRENQTTYIVFNTFFQNIVRYVSNLEEYK